MSCGYVLLEWTLEPGVHSVVSIRSIVKPRKDFEEYEVDMEVSAMYQGKVYPAKIVDLSGEYLQTGLIRSL